MQTKFNKQIYEEACEWFVECRNGDIDTAARRDFNDWLYRSPQHLSAYLEIAAIWNEAPSLDPQQRFDSATLVAESLASDDNVVPLTDAVRTASPPQSATTTGHTEMRPWRRLALAASLMVFVVCASIWWQLGRVDTYTTAVGEQRSIVLADGSMVELNALSKIKIRYSKHERAVELLQGQALFHVAKDRARPFIVTSDRTRVRAVGTQFDVYKKHDGTIVTVVEGRVAVLAGAALPGFDAMAAAADPTAPLTSESVNEHQIVTQDAAVMLLSAGEQVTIADGKAEKTRQPDIMGATAWTQRQLVFESASLAEVVQEFNRYNQRRLVIEDTELYDFHISGVFSSTDPSSLLHFLRERPDVQVIETESEIRIVKKTS